MAVVEEVEEEEDREEEESADGEMPAEEEGMLVTEVVVKQSDETFSEVSSERFSTDEESINKELLARILVNAVTRLWGQSVLARGSYVFEGDDSSSLMRTRTMKRGNQNIAIACCYRTLF